MKTAIQRWGNSLALRIPKVFAEQANMKRGTAVSLTLEKQRLIVAPLRTKESSLKSLLAKVTPENIHSETDWGPPVGEESW